MNTTKNITIIMIMTTTEVRPVVMEDRPVVLEDRPAVMVVVEMIHTVVR